MRENEFWCRAFLAEMSGTSSRTMVNWEHDRATERFVKAADAALDAARRRGMVTGERTVSAAPELERVEFMAAPDELKPGWWRVGVHDVGVFVMMPRDERVTRTDGNAIRIKWGESMPPKPIEVWIERPVVKVRP